jgi:hypothetical protein
MSSLHYCPRCDRGYTSQLAALDCEDQCILEDADRKSGRLFRMNRDAGGIFPSSD